MNKELLHWVLIIALTTIGFFLLTGCANMQMAENNKRDAEYRKQALAESDRTVEYKSTGTGPIEMPQKWMDQWPSE